MPGRLIDILLVEDNPADVRLAQEALRDYNIQNALHVVTDGEEALAYLRKEGKHSQAVTPDMILLDINLPKIDGIEVLAEMQLDPLLRDIPVVVLTTSKLDQQILKKYNVLPDCYVAKPLTLERYLDAVKCFPHMGLSIVNLSATPAGYGLAID
ncbi:MAG TPA: response regulator [Bryobacteraceae bacterium]|nr:response regulator [Bryobacteraceae bacterium]